MKRFWVASGIWIVIVAVATPFIIEVADDRGFGLVVPGLSVTASEILIAAMLALGPPLAALCWRWRKRLDG